MVTRDKKKTTLALSVAKKFLRQRKRLRKWYSDGRQVADIIDRAFNPLFRVLRMKPEFEHVPDIVLQRKYVEPAIARAQHDLKRKGEVDGLEPIQARVKANPAVCHPRIDEGGIQFGSTHQIEVSRSDDVVVPTEVEDACQWASDTPYTVNGEFREVLCDANRQRTSDQKPLISEHFARWSGAIAELGCEVGVSAGVLSLISRVHAPRAWQALSGEKACLDMPKMKIDRRKAYWKYFLKLIDQNGWDMDRWFNNKGRYDHKKSAKLMATDAGSDAEARCAMAIAEVDETGCTGYVHHIDQHASLRSHIHAFLGDPNLAAIVNMNHPDWVNTHHYIAANLRNMEAGSRLSSLPYGKFTNSELVNMFIKSGFTETGYAAGAASVARSWLGLKPNDETDALVDEEVAAMLDDIFVMGEDGPLTTQIKNQLVPPIFRNLYLHSKDGRKGIESCTTEEQLKVLTAVGGEYRNRLIGKDGSRESISGCLFPYIAKYLQTCRACWQNQMGFPDYVLRPQDGTDDAEKRKAFLANYVTTDDKWPTAWRTPLNFLCIPNLYRRDKTGKKRPIKFQTDSGKERHCKVHERTLDTLGMQLPPLVIHSLDATMMLHSLLLGKERNVYIQPTHDDWGVQIPHLIAAQEMAVESFNWTHATQTIWEQLGVKVTRRAPKINTSAQILR